MAQLPTIMSGVVITRAGKTYQVGEFSTDKKEGDDALYVKLRSSL